MTLNDTDCSEGTLGLQVTNNHAEFIASERTMPTETCECIEIVANKFTLSLRTDTVFIISLRISPFSELALLSILHT